MTHAKEPAKARELGAGRYSEAGRALIHNIFTAYFLLWELTRVKQPYPSPNLSQISQPETGKGDFEWSSLRFLSHWRFLCIPYGLRFPVPAAVTADLAHSMDPASRQTALTHDQGPILSP